MATPSADRSIRARNAALSRHARSDTVAATQPARDAYMATFDDAVDPSRELAPDERERRAARLRKVHFSNLARKRWRK